MPSKNKQPPFNLDLNGQWFVPTKSWDQRFEGPSKGKGKRSDENDAKNQVFGLTILSKIIEHHDGEIKRIYQDFDLDPANGAYGKVDFGVEYIHQGKLKFALLEFKGRSNVHAVFLKQGLWLSVSKRDALFDMEFNVIGKYDSTDKFFMWATPSFAILRHIHESIPESESRFPVVIRGAKPRDNAVCLEPIHEVTFEPDEGLMVHIDGRVGRPSDF